MTNTEFLTALREHVSAQERQQLLDKDPALVIGKFNREKMLALLSDEGGEGSVDEETACALHRALQAYLDRFMPDLTAGHKWVILVSLYQALCRREPMHPIDVVGIRTAEENGETVYYCPTKSPEKGGVCSFCVCQEDTDAHKF